MKRLLLATAAAGLAFAAPVFAQTTTPVPADPPPIVAEQPDTDETPQDQLATPGTPETSAPAPAAAVPNTPAPQAAVTGEGRTELATPSITPAPQTAQAPTTGAVAAMPPADAQATVTAPDPQAAAAADTQSPAPTLHAESNEALAIPASASDVCAARTTSVHFGARGSGLSRENQNAIQYATDAASACNLQTVTIVDSAEGRTHSRRAEAVRATLVRQGVPAERITIAEEVNADPEAASTGRLDLRMQFAGAASQAALEPTATSGVNAAAQPTLEVAENVAPSTAAPRAPAPAPQAAPPAPAPEAPAPGVEDLAQPATPPVETPEQQPGT